MVFNHRYYSVSAVSVSVVAVAAAASNRTVSCADAMYSFAIRADPIDTP